ncbi:MAG: GntR family transcriptional regulator [marine bacterium B5-7]|nr:MAG: GntR family transcriptional regulator [marine bacterium B5-7]
MFTDNEPLQPIIAGNGPLYAQVRDILMQRVQKGAWKPGKPIPGESHLASELEVSQGTVRKAIGELVARNVLVRQQGKGTFVAAHDRRRELFHFFHIVADHSDRSHPRSHTLSCRRRVATRREKESLGLEDGGQVVRIERVRDLSHKNVFFETIAVSARKFPGLDKLTPNDLPNTLYEFYETQYGITIHRADEKIKAVLAGARIARTLDIDKGAALLSIERTAYDLNGLAVELRTSLVNTHSHHYSSQVT